MNSQPGFAQFLRKYLRGDEDFRRENRHVLQGLDILSRLENLYEHGRMTAAAVRREIRSAALDRDQPEWQAEAEAAVGAFLSASQGKGAETRGSYAWLWQEAARLLNHNANQEGQ